MRLLSGQLSTFIINLMHADFDKTIFFFFHTAVMRIIGAKHAELL